MQRNQSLHAHNLSPPQGDTQLKYHLSTDRAELRKTLLDNGYKPLPLADKGVFIKGWSRAEITSDWLAPFDRIGRYLNTGLRCDDLIAFDIDVYDELLADKCEAYIEQHAGDTDFCRVGQWPKRLLLYRGSGDKSGRTGNYAGHMVELLCGPGRQFASYGTHPKTRESYSWDELHPATTPLDQVPALDFDKAQEILKGLDELLAESGYALKRRPHMRGTSGQDEYDLEPDTVVKYEGVEIEWGVLCEQLDTDGGFGNLWREEYGEFGDSDAVHFYLAHGSREPAAHDFVNDCTHWSSLFNKQFAALLPPPPKDDTFTDDKLVDLYENCVILPEGNGSVRRLSDPTRMYTLSGFRQTIKHMRTPAPTRQNPNRTVEVFVGWLEDPKALRADYPQFRPDKAPGVFRQGRLKLLNSYNPPDHSAKGGTTDTFWELVEHLIPSAGEMALFEGWLMHKAQHPEDRMHGFLMVTPEYGTGRGTLFGIIRKLFGEAYVNEIELADAIGTGSGQSAFNQFMAESVIVTMSEALEEREDVSRWQSRHVAYERLKLIVDPTASSMQIKRKYGTNSVENIYASVLISSNHPDALAIAPGDRRMIVVDNCEVRIEDAPDDLRGRIHEWSADPSNIAELWRELRESPYVYDAHGDAPMTPAKERMIEAAQSDMDRLWEIFADSAKGDICTMAQWRRFANQNAQAYELSLPTTPEKRDSGLVKVMQSKCRRCEELPKSGLKVKGNVVRPWILRNFSKWKGSEDRAAIRAEIVKNGDPGGAVVHLPDID